MLRVFVGYDHVEAQAWHTLTHSILMRSSVPVSFSPIKQTLLPEFTRPRDAKQSNEFSFTRFLTPYLARFHGWAVFMDCDMMLRTDIGELLSLLDDRYAVMCCPHDYVPKQRTKYLGNVQHAYPRKNWSSFMAFNCGHEYTRRLTPMYVNQASGLDLHRMIWAEDAVGELPLEWNWLVGEYDYNPDAKVVHWTVGGPWNEAYKDCDYSDEWRAEMTSMNHALSDGENHAAA